MEKDIFKCVCDAKISLPDEILAGTCPRCSRLIIRKYGTKVDRENLPPFSGLNKTMKW